MDDTPPSRSARPTPPQSRPFSRPDEVIGRPTPLSTRPVLFVPGGSRPATDAGGVAAVPVNAAAGDGAASRPTVAREWEDAAPCVAPAPDGEATAPAPRPMAEPEPAVGASEPAPPLGPSDEPWFPEPAPGVRAVVAGGIGAPVSPESSLSFPTATSALPAPASTLDPEPSAREAAAGVLEALAGRVRQGAIALPDVVPGRGEAAMLAAILAAMLARGEGLDEQGTGPGGGAGDPG